MSPRMPAIPVRAMPVPAMPDRAELPRRHVQQEVPA